MVLLCNHHYLILNQLFCLNLDRGQAPEVRDYILGLERIGVLKRHALDRLVQYGRGSERARATVGLPPAVGDLPVLDSDEDQHLIPALYLSHDPASVAWPGGLLARKDVARVHEMVFYDV